MKNWVSLKRLAQSFFALSFAVAYHYKLAPGAVSA